MSFIPAVTHSVRRKDETNSSTRFNSMWRICFFRNIPRGRKMIWPVSEVLFDAHCSFSELWHCVVWRRENCWTHWTRDRSQSQVRCGSTSSVLNMERASSVAAQNSYSAFQYDISWISVILLLMTASQTSYISTDFKTIGVTWNVKWWKF